MAAVFDAFSRVPLVLQVFDAKPGARDMAQLLRRAARAFAKPRYVITDLGGEFTGGAFRNAVKHLGAVQRFAAADSLKATARLERFWRTLKETAGIRALGLPLDREDLERRLETALLFYGCLRPNEGLKGARPLKPSSARSRSSASRS
jgi:transposase InsO family protein